MYYLKEITIPFTPLGTDPIIGREVLKVTMGIATEQWFMFPEGCYGLANIQVWHHGWQVWPWQTLDSFHWNNFVYHIRDRYPFTAEPLEVVLRTWNEDDSFDHTLTFAMVVDPLPAPTEIEDLRQIYEDLGLEVDV